MMFGKARLATGVMIVSVSALLLAQMASGLPSVGQSVGWPVHGGTDLEQRFSPLKQINGANIGQLGLAWSFEVDTNRGQEATPIVVDGVMYVSTAWSKVYALDAVSGRQLWRYDPEVAGRKGFDACCDVVSRGVAVANGRVFLGALDGRLIALDAHTGKKLWSTQTTDTAKAYTITGAPRVFEGKVVIGNGGAEYGMRGYVSAFDARTGKQLWRFYTVPGDPKAKPDGAASDAILRKAALSTWAGRWYDYGGGGTVWDAIVFDPELHQLYIGVGNGGPWNQRVRSDGKGDNLFLSSIVALDPDTGAYKWHYQETPGESWDFTASQPIILANLKIEGKDRKVLMQAPKNGFFYVLDRTSGKLISAKNFVPMNWATGVDMATGRPIENPDARYRDKMFVMYPNALGGHSWHPMAFSPLTGLVYLPTYHSLFAYGDDKNFKNVPGTWNTAVDQKLLTPPDDPVALKKGGAVSEGRIIAWDPVANKEVWSVLHATLQNGGVLATASNLIFQGTGDGHFEARKAEDGKLLWSFPTQAGIIAGPVSYEQNGAQYVAVFAGYGGGLGLGEPGDAPTVRPNGRMLVFKIGGQAKLERVALAPAALDPPSEKFTDQQVDNGRLLYTQHCYRCHGAGAQSVGVLPDLRRSAALSDPAMWHSILIDGALESSGMVSFKNWLTSAQVEEIRAYVALKANIAERQPPQQSSVNAPRKVDAMKPAAAISNEDQRGLESLHDRYIHATDRHDFALLRSLYTDDAIEHHADYNGPIDGFILWLKQALGYFEIATHTVTNLVFAVDGDTAESEGRGTAYLRLKGNPPSNMIVVNRLFDSYRKVGGQWLFTRRSLSADWVQQFPAGDGGLAMVKSVPAGKVGLDDPVYKDVPAVIGKLRAGLPPLAAPPEPPAPHP